MPKNEIAYLPRYILKDVAIMAYGSGLLCPMCLVACELARCRVIVSPHLACSLSLSSALRRFRSRQCHARAFARGNQSACCCGKATNNACSHRWRPLLTCLISAPVVTPYSRQCLGSLLTSVSSVLLKRKRERDSTPKEHCFDSVRWLL